MYGPPPGPPPAPHRVRPTYPGRTVGILAGTCLLVGLLGGCVMGVAIGSTPPAGTTAAESPSVTGSTATPDDPEPSETREQKSPKPTPKKTTRKPELPDTDPRYSSCTKAKRRGYGPYHRGIDPEYRWYEDRDKDGAVCE